MVHHDVIEPGNARISFLREPGGVPLAQHLHGGAPTTPCPQPFAVRCQSSLGMIIAIDGPAASGKGTLGRRLAAHYGLRHLDTGLIYRAVAKAMLEGAHQLDDVEQAVRAANALVPATFNETELK